MWKKEGEPDPIPAPRPESTPSFERPVPPRTPGDRATIGRSITIHGEVSGDEDLLIQGRVDGAVNLRQHSVTVGPEGEVKADITARVITVEGRVSGNLKAEQQVILRSSALVEGDIAAPRVVLEDGARFRGGVDMGESVASERAAGARGRTGAVETGRTGDMSGGRDRSTAAESAGGRPKDGVPQTTPPLAR